MFVRMEFLVLGLTNRAIKGEVPLAKSLLNIVHENHTRMVNINVVQNVIITEHGHTTGRKLEAMDAAVMARLQQIV